MEFLNGLRAKISNQVSAGKATTHVIIGGLCALAVVCYMIANQSKTEINSVPLFDARDFSADELHSMELSLGKAGLNDYEIQGNKICVQKSQRATYIKALAESNAVPTAFSDSRQSKSAVGFWRSRREQENLNRIAKQEKIRAMIREIQGVEDAMVEIDELVSDGFPKKIHRTAVVSVKSKQNQSLSEAAIYTIRTTTQRSIAGLKAEDVAVIDTSAARTHDSDSLKASNDFTEYAEAKSFFEELWKSKVESILTGFDDVTVAVQVELGTMPQIETPTAKSEVDHAESQTALSSELKKQDSAMLVSTLKPGTNRSAKITSRIQEPPAKISGNTAFPAENAVKQASFQAKAAVPVSTSTPYVPVAASVSIGISEDFLRKLASRSNSIETESQLSDLEVLRVFNELRFDISRRLIPILPGDVTPENSANFIAVSIKPSSATSNKEADSEEQLANDFVTDLIGWLQNRWELVLLGLFVFGTLIYNRAKRQDTSGSPLANLIPNENANTHRSSRTVVDYQEADQIDRAFDIDDQTALSHEVAQTIEKDPNASMSVVQSWMTREKN